MFAVWNAMSRQKRVGWLILIVSIGYGLYFLKARLLADGPEITRKEWLQFVLTFVGIILGTINIRMAEMRERNQKTMPLVDSSRTAKK